MTAEQKLEKCKELVETLDAQLAGLYYCLPTDVKDNVEDLQAVLEETDE